MISAITTLPVHESYHLYISPDTYTFESTQGIAEISSTARNTTTETLVIERDKGTLRINGPLPPTLRQEEVITVYGIIGIIQLNVGDYLLVITDRTRVGRLNGHDVYQLKKYQLFRIPRHDTHLSESQKRDDQRYLQMIDQHFRSGQFYFSYSYDLTHSAQRAASLSPQLALWQRADTRFFWNRHLMQRLMDLSSTDPSQNLSGFILPIVCGFMEIKSVTINNLPLTFALLSRRSVYRAGTRYNSRGIDTSGNVSNFVETEQLVILNHNGDTLSFVQIRGSMPMFWRQDVNVKYVPQLVLENRVESGQAARTHFDGLKQTYGGVYCVNLINKKGYEGRLGMEFKNVVEELKDPQIQYTHFDFHHECAKMRHDRLSILVSQLSSSLDTYGYFHMTSTGAIKRTQSGTIRSNCMDCLDRTNVVQSVFGREMLERQLRVVGVLGSGIGVDKIVDEVGFEHVFKNVWADNADAISTNYSGTGALKTDYTRTGKRTKAGALQDGINSMIRYWKNNFMDGSRQDGFELVLGNYRVYPARISPFHGWEVERTWKYYTLPSLLLLSILCIIFTLIFPKLTFFSTLTYLIIYTLCAFFISRLIIASGKEFVDRPRLVGERLLPNNANGGIIGNSPIGGGYGMKELIKNVAMMEREKAEKGELKEA